MEEYVECEKCKGSGMKILYNCKAFKAAICAKYGVCIGHDTKCFLLNEYPSLMTKCEACSGLGKITWIDKLFKG